MKKRATVALGETHVSAANVMATPNAPRALLDYHNDAGTDRAGDIEVEVRAGWKVFAVETSVRARSQLTLKD